MPGKEYNLSYKEVADLLGVSRRSIQRYVNDGGLDTKTVITRHGEIRVFNKEDVLAYKEAREQQQHIKKENKKEGGAGGTGDKQALMYQANMLLKLEQENFGLNEKLGNLREEIGTFRTQVEERKKDINRLKTNIRRKNFTIQKTKKRAEIDIKKIEGDRTKYISLIKTRYDNKIFVMSLVFLGVVVLVGLIIYAIVSGRLSL